VFCIIFHIPLKTPLLWYFNLHIGSITNWGDFHKIFLDKFTEEMTIGALMDEFFTLVMSPKYKIKYFNQSFTTFLNKFKYGTMPSPKLQIKVYANALPTTISMFVK
jgi:hypothetical protein